MGDAFITRKGGGGFKLDPPEITYISQGDTYIQFTLTNTSAITGNVYYTLNWDGSTDISEWVIAHPETSGIEALSDASLAPANVSDAITISGLAAGDHTLTAVLYLTLVLQSEPGVYTFQGLTGVVAELPSFGALTQNTFYASGIDITNTNVDIPLTIEHIITTSADAPAAYSYSGLVNPSAVLNVTDIPVTQGGTYYWHARLVDGTIAGANVVFGPYTAPSMYEPSIVSYTFGGTYFALTVKNNEPSSGGVPLDIYYNNSTTITTADSKFSDVAPQTNAGPTDTILTTDHTIYIKAYHAASDQWSDLVTGPLVEIPLFLFSSWTFTSCGQNGPYGPSQSSCQSSYSSASWETDSNLFYVNSGIQYWKVPETGTYRITAIGGSGGSAVSPVYPGRGVKIRADFPLSKGTWLKILVGQGGVNQDDTQQNCDSGGGGGTFVSTIDNIPIIVAGGGSGADRDETRGYDGRTYTSGGDGKANVGSGGTNGSGGARGSYPQAGAGFFGNGAQTGWSSGSGFTIAYAFVNGGSGGTSINNSPNINGGFGGGGAGHGNCCIGSGGGGGYSGGGGGNDSCGYAGAGGSFIASNGTNRATSNGYYEGSTSGITNLGSYNTYYYYTQGYSYSANGSVLIEKL